MESIEILSVIPLAGTYEEINLGNTNDLVWILVTNVYSNKFIIKVDKGVRWGENKVEILKSGLAVILSGGSIHLFDINTKKLVYSDNESYFVDFIVDRDNQQIIMHNDLSLVVFDFSLSLIHKTKRVSLDGFKFDKIENGILKGKYNNLSENWGTFEYNISKNDFACDWKIPESWQ